MKYFARALLLAVVLCLVLSVCACGDNSKKTKAPTETEPYRLYAKWTKLFDDISYELNGGSPQSDWQTEIAMGAAMALPTDLVKDGVSFVGWYDNPNFEGTPITAIPASHDAPITLYARTLVVYDFEGEDYASPKIDASPDFGEETRVISLDGLALGTALYAKYGD